MKTLSITPKTITKYLLAIVFFLVTLHLIGLILEYQLGIKIESVDLNVEKNLPTFYAVMSIILAAGILWKISMVSREKKDQIYWRFLSAIFVFLAVDEFYSIHERESIKSIGRDSFNMLGTLDGYLHFAWFIPYLAVFGLISVFFVKFFIQLPKPTKIRFIIAGSVFIAGAVGMEMLGGKYIDIVGMEGFEHLPYRILTTVEEFLEMLGIVLFINALTKYYLIAVGEKEVGVSLHIAEDKVDYVHVKEKIEPKETAKIAVNE